MIQNAIGYCKDSLIKGDTKANETPIEEPETEAKVLDIPSPCSMDIDSQTSNQLPQVINGVPKGLRIEDVLGRIAVLLLIRDKVANFEYIDEVEAAAEEEARKASTENKTTTNNPDRASYWEESLKDRYEVQKFEEFNAMGKGNRSRKQMVSVEDEDLAGLEDVSSEGEDDNYEAELTDEETAASGILTGRRPYRKKIRVDSAESLPLMEGEGRSFRGKGFNQNQSSRACQTSHWKSGHETKCKDFQLSGQVKSMQSAYMQHGRRYSSAVALVPSSGTVNITKQSKEILFPYEDFVELFNWDKRGFPPCGLLNCGNSCFANVVLQCLVYTRPLVAYLLEKGHRKECRRNDWCFLCEFQTHVERSSESRHPFSPINILSRLPNIGGDLGYGKQEDAHEFMRFAIDTMQSVCLDEFGGEKALHPSTQETTLIQHIFGGHLQSQVICTKCNNVSNQYENMMDLTVEIQGDATSLEECLDLFTVRERLHGDNMYKCDGCNEYVMAWKRLTVRRAPNILTIALKRFQSGRFGKLNKRVTFPETLDLSPYMSEVGDGNDVYKLYAVVVHVDMLNASFFGHYICYTKDFCGKWYRIDDCKVMRVDLEEVLSQGAYMLLYSRVCARPSCLKPIESLTKGKQQTVQEGEPHVKQSVEFLTTAESINGICASGSLSSDSDSQEKVSTCEKERTNSEDVREDIETVDSESSSSVPQDIEVHGNGYSHAIEETASPVVHANRLVSAVGSSVSEMVKPEAYSQNSESDFPHSAVDEITAESSAERLTESSSESAQPIQNGVREEGKISHDAPVGNLSSGELLDEISPVDCNGEQAKTETGKGLPSSSSTKDATGKMARRNSSEGKWKPLFPPGFLRKHSGNNSPKRGGKAKAPLELAECASSYNPNKVISGFAKPGFLNQNGARTKDVGKSHSKCSSSSSPTFEERVGNHLDKDVMVLSGSGDFNHCNGDSGAFVISDEGVSYISGDDQQLAGKTSSCKEKLHESETTPEKIRTDSEKPRATRRSSMRVLMSCGFCSASSSLSMILGLMGCWVVVLLFFWINDIRVRHGVFLVY